MLPEEAPRPALFWAMGRRERFAQYQWAAWPDETLVEASAHLYMPYVRRVEQGFHNGPDLVVELTGEYFADVAAAEAQYAAFGNSKPGLERTLRLTWQSRWEEVDGGLNGGGVTLHHSERIYAVETYPEEYSGPSAHSYSWNSEAPDCGSTFLEVVNDPDPWITEILEDSPDYGVFPLGGRAVQVHPDTWELNKGSGWETPTGRFYPPGSGDQVESGDYFWTGPNPPTPEERAEMDRQVKRNQQAQAALERARPRYRHLFISSNSVMVELLCEGLPRWEWVEVP